MYRIIRNNNNNVEIIFHIQKQCWIPVDENNMDYQEYLAWLEAGNTPEEVEK